MVHAYTAASIFTGSAYLAGHAILVKEGSITALVPLAKLPGDVALTDYGNGLIVPAFFDNQVYGAGGLLFAVHPTIEALKKLYAHCASGGAHHFMPTVATNPYPVFYQCIDAVRAYQQAGGKGCMGLHIEGPWINEVRRGAHIASLIHSPTVEQARELLEYGKGIIKMITLAPEVCSREVIDLVQSYGIIVAAGHSNATFAQATAAFDDGIKTATHLFNTMSPLQHRAPGMVGAIMHHPTAMCSIIPDGYHVDFEVIAIAKKVMGERLYMITDAVTDTTQGPYPHQLEGDKYVSNGILSGSAITIIQGVKNCIEKVGIEPAEALRMASLYPAQVINLDHQFGRIAPGYKAALLVLDEGYNITAHVSA